MPVVDGSDLVVGVVSLLVGVLLGSWLDLFLQRPKLALEGWGAGTYATLTVTNQPGFFGLSIGRTVILGRPVLSGRRWALSTERLPARCNAYITDAENAAHGLPLYFGAPGDNPEPQQFAEIRSGESASIIVFAVRPEEKRYFIVQPANSWEVGPSSVAFDSPHKFIVHIAHDRSDRTLDVPIAVRRNLQGDWYFEVEGPKSARSSTFLM